MAGKLDSYPGMLSATDHGRRSWQRYACVRYLIACGATPLLAPPTKRAKVVDCVCRCDASALWVRSGESLQGKEF